MASSATPYLLSPQPQLILNSSSRKSPQKPNHHTHKPLKNLHFHFKPTLSPFPLTLKPSSSHSHLVHSHPVQENPKLQDLETETQTQTQQQRLFFQDPPWVPPLFLKDLLFRSPSPRSAVRLESGEMDRRRYDALRRRQVRAETEAWERTVEEYAEIEREMRERRLAPNLPHVKALFSGWFEPLRAAIEKEQKVKTSKQKVAFAPNIDLLPAEKTAVIVMHKMMGLVMLGNEDDDRCVQVVQAAIQIGAAVEHEVI